MSIERILSKAQARAVLALVGERERITREANEQITGINAALAEQAEMMRAHFGLQEGDYEFTGTPDEIKLVMRQKPVSNDEPAE